MSELRLSASQEDYLEAIFNISQKKQVARAKDIAQALGVKASSVTSALRSLAAIELVNYAPYDLITLTNRGSEVAREIVARHQALSSFLITVLGIEPDEADQAACKMEHAVPKTIIHRLAKYADYVRHCPRSGITWDSGFGYYCQTGCVAKDCERNQDKLSQQDQNPS